MISKFRALLGGWLSDPYVCCTIGSLLLLRGVDAIAAQAKAAAEQIAQVQAQHQQLQTQHLGLWGDTPHQHLGAEVSPDGAQPRPAPVDVAGEHEDLHL